MDDPRKAVLITGCSSGIGRATALRLKNAGWLVYATARRRASVEDLARAGCRTIELDVTDEASRERAVAQVEADCGAVAALVNNAGYSQSGTIEETPVELVRRQFETNFFGLAALTQLVLPGMRRAGRGRIVNLGSMGGTLVFPGGGLLPRDEVRAGGLKRCFAVRDRGPRDRRHPHTAGADSYRVFGDGCFERAAAAG